MDLFLEEDIEIIKRLRHTKDFKAEDLLSKKKLSKFELDLIMNNE